MSMKYLPISKIGIMKRKIKIMLFRIKQQMEKRINYDAKEAECLFEEEVEYTGSSASGTNNGSLINFIDRLENKINDKRLEFLFGEASKKISFRRNIA